MNNRYGNGWQWWLVLAAAWTLISLGSAWTSLPRAPHMPHDPLYLSKLSSESAAILRHNGAAVAPARGGLVWSEPARVVRMRNGTALTFPPVTSGVQVAFVTDEYHKLLDEQADARRWPYLLGKLALWLLPCGGLWLVALAVQRWRTATPLQPLQLIEPTVRQRTDYTCWRQHNQRIDRAAVNAAAAPAKTVRRGPRERGFFDNALQTTGIMTGADRGSI
jgi:hypothetical protein